MKDLIYISFWPMSLAIVSFIWFRLGKETGYEQGYMEGFYDCREE